MFPFKPSHYRPGDRFFHLANSEPRRLPSERLLTRVVRCASASKALHQFAKDYPQLSFFLGQPLPRAGHRSLARLLGGEFFFILGYICSSSSSGSGSISGKKVKFLLTLSRVNDLMFHSAKCRRHNDASPHLCLAGEANLSSILAPNSPGVASVLIRSGND
jgi:hypothetical protein